MRDLFADYEEACDNTLLDRRARQRRDRVRQRGAARRSPTPPGSRRGLLPARALHRGRQGALRRSRPVPRCSSASSSSSASSRRWGSRRTSSSCGTSCATRARAASASVPGRGSAAGSCVAYCLRIVDIDPIKYDLLFERFLNPGRKQMPDIDMDFDSRYRGEMIKYAAERYGWDHVAQIVTFSTIKARAAVRDSARVLGYPYAVGDKIAKLMPPLDHGPRHAAARVLREGHRPRGRLQDGRRAAHALRGRSRRQARHRRRPRPRGAAPPGRHPRRRGRDHARAAHRVPADPAQAGGGREASRTRPIVTQYEMHGVEDLGLLKMDFLGLRNLDVLEITLDLIERAHRRTVPTSTASRSTTPRPSTCSAAATPSACSSSKAGRCARCCARCAHRVRGRRRARRAVPPGPDGPELAQRVRRPQERAQAGHLPARRPRGDARAHLRADDLPGAADARRAAARRLLARGGRQPPQGDGQEDPRADRQGAHEVRRRLRRAGPHRGSSASEIFDIIEPFADYSFNKSHSVGYGFVAYQTA